MTKGDLKDNRPYITISITWGGRVQDIPALIDTGFDGDVRVSREEAKYLNLITEHVQVLGFADGSTKDVPGSVGYVEFNNMINVVNITILDGGSTIGMGFLKKFNAILTINLKQKCVTIA